MKMSLFVGITIIAQVRLKGINILNMLYSSGDTKIPVAFELIEKPVVFYDISWQAICKTLSAEV